MAANPFYIDPWAGQSQNIAQGLAGLGSVVRERREEKQNQELRASAQEIFERGNPDEIAQFMIANPEIGKQAAGGMQFASELTEKNLVESAKRVLSSEDPEAVLTERIRIVQEQGGDPSDSIEALQEYREDPKGFMAGAEKLFAMRDPQGHGAWKKATSTQQDFGEIGKKVRAAGFDPATPEGQRYARQLLEGSRGAGAVKPTANRQDYEYWQQLKKTDPAGADAFARQVGLKPKDKTLSAAAEKALISSQDRYFQLSEQSREYDVLADDYERFKDTLATGTPATISEFFKSVTGSQDEASELRRRLAKVRLSEALKYLPPGPATDRDVAEAFKGVPATTASPDQVQSFLRGSAKIARLESDFQQFKSDYISQNNGTQGMIKAWKQAIENGEIQSVNDLRRPSTDKPVTDMSDDELLQAAMGAK